MAHQVAVQTPGRRAAAYWFVDGLPELSFGLTYILWSALGLAWGFDTKNLWLKWAVVVAACTFIVLFCLNHRVIEFFKARLTYRRTGYVRPPSEARTGPDGLGTLFSPTKPADENVTRFRTRTVFVFFLAMQLFQVLTSATSPNQTQWWVIPLLMTIAAGALYWWTKEEPRNYPWWSFVLIAAAGFVSVAFAMPMRSRMFIPLMIGGLWLAGNGAWQLARYLRENPA